MNNMQAFLIDADAVAQAVKTNLLLLQGEWWEDTSQGLPFFQSIVGQSGTPDHLSAADLLIKERILSTQGVASIQGFQSSYANRNYTIQNVTVTTTAGQTISLSGVTL